MPRPRPAAAALTLCALALAAGCRGGGPRSAEGATPSTATRATVAPTTALPRATSPACPTIPARAQPSPDRPRYALTADVRTAQGVVGGTLQVRFTPDIDTDRLVFRLWPNGTDLAKAGAHIDTGPVTMAGTPVAATLENPTTLVVRPGGTLARGRAVDVAMPWTLRLPASSNDRISVDGDAVRLGSFFPILAWEPGVGWAVDPSTGGFAEDSTAPTADFDLSLTVPPGATAIAGGVNDRPGHWTATAMRDIAVSVGRFTTATGVANAPDPVRVTVGVQAGTGERPERYRTLAVRVLESYAQRFGPYPWPTFTMAITPDLGGGIEYPGHVMQGPGTLAFITPHEIGHQWFYGLVGNDQGRDPWLDEGLATWAETRFDDTVDELRRALIPPAAKGHVGEPMTYWASHEPAYQDGAYTQGAQVVAALGDPRLVDCALRVYVAQKAYGIARPHDLVAAASTVFPDAEATFARYGITG